MIIVPTYTTNVDNNAPAGFKACAQRVIDFLHSNYINPVTIPITVDYAAIASLGSSSFGVSFSTYAQLRAALSAKAVTANAIAAVASLPGSDPTGGNTCEMAQPLAFALGLDVSAGSSGCTFRSTVTWTTDNSGGVAPGTFDLQGVIIHEFTEVLGRIRAAGAGEYTILDLFAYTAPGTRTINTKGGYFSINNGTTNLSTPNAFNTGAGDGGDWNGAAVDACNANLGSSVVLPFSTYDQIIMDVLGWQFSIPVPPPPPPSGGPADPPARTSSAVNLSTAFKADTTNYIA